MINMVYPEDVIKFIQSTYDEKNINSIEVILSFLRKKGYSQLQTVFLISKECKLSFTEANRFVMNSETWA